MASLPPADPTCPRVKNVLLLDSEGRRIAVKYFCKDWPTINAQSKYEKSVFTKTSRSNARGEAEITMFDNVRAFMSSALRAYFVELRELEWSGWPCRCVSLLWCGKGRGRGTTSAASFRISGRGVFFFHTHLTQEPKITTNF